MIRGAPPEPRARYRYALVKAPFGAVRVTESGAGLVAVELIAQPLAVLSSRLRGAGGGATEPVLEQVREHASSRALAEYLRGGLQSFSLPLDWSLSAGFVRRVLQRLAKLPFGATLSYGDLALLVGQPGGARAVGGAMGRNPLPIVVPCHRVLAAGRKLGGFTGGLALKRWLLEHEGQHVAADGSVAGPGARQLQLIG